MSNRLAVAHLLSDRLWWSLVLMMESYITHVFLLLRSP